MKAYKGWGPDGLVFVATQVLAKPLKDVEIVNTGTSKEEQLAFINQVVAWSRAIPIPDMRPNTTPAGDPAVLKSMAATEVLSRLDGPPNVDEIVETIGASNGYALRRFAGAVAVAFQHLEK